MAAPKGVRTIITKAGSIVDLGLFPIQLTRPDSLDHLDLAISKESKWTESACCAISGKLFSEEIILTASVPQKPVALPAESIIKCEESKTPSMVDDIDEESKSSDDLENIYDGIQNLESTTLDDGEGNHGPVHQYNRMTLRSSRKSTDNLAEAKSLTNQ